MKRLVFLLALLVIAALLAWSQTSTQPPAQPSHNHAQMHAEHMEHMQAMCKQMMDEHMRGINATSQALATNLAQLKATLPLINDVNERSRWQSNIAMWQALADHFGQMARHAEHMQRMGMGCGMMGDDRGHVHTMPENPAKPQ